VIGQLLARGVFISFTAKPCLDSVNPDRTSLFHI
jgi:hypothetical protein